MPATPFARLLFAFLCLVWGSTWLVIKIGLAGVPPFLGAGLRFLLASVVLFAAVALRGRGASLDRDGKIAVLSAGLLSFTLSYAGVYWAEQYISSGLTAVLYCMMPLCVALLSRYWMRSEVLTARKVAGIVTGIAGTVLLFRPAAASSAREAAGVAAALASVAAAAVNLVILKRRAGKADVFVLNAWAMGLGAACLLAMSALFESYDTLTWTRANVLAIVYLSLAGSVAAFVAYFRLLRDMEASKLSLITLIFPIIAVLLGTAVLGETIDPLTWAGMGVVLFGVAIALF